MFRATKFWKRIWAGAAYTVLFVSFFAGCETDDGPESKSGLWLELDGTRSIYDMRPAFFLHARGGAYDWGKSVQWNTNDMRYEGLRYYRGEMVESPEDWQLLVEVYGGAKKSGTQLEKLVIENSVPVLFKLNNMQQWQVWTRHDGPKLEEVNDALNLPPGKHEFKVEAER